MTEDATAMISQNSYMNYVRLLANYGDVYIRSLTNQVHECFTNEFDAIKAVKGFYHKDEPSYEFIDTMQPMVTWHNQYAQGKLFHVNLLPSYGFSQNSRQKHAEYVDKYVNQVLAKVTTPKTLGLDNYPLIKSDNANCIRTSYLADLLVIAETARDYNARPDRTSDITTGFCVQAFNTKDDALRDILSKADISFQTNTSLAMGAKYLQYFCYAALPVSGITGLENNDDIYNYVKEVNQELRNWDSVILDFDWMNAKILMGSTEEAATNYKALAAVRELSESSLVKVDSVTSTEGTLIGEFQNDFDKYGYMTVNFTEPSEAKTDIVSYSFVSSVKTVFVYQNGEATRWDLDNDRQLILTIEAGEAAFVIPCE